MNLRLHRLAVAEIDHEVDYYESRQPGLGNELEDDIDAALSLILRFPEAAPQWRGRSDRRVTALRRFPFTIPYQIAHEDIVVLVDRAQSSRGGRGVLLPPSIPTTRSPACHDGCFDSMTSLTVPPTITSSSARDGRTNVRRSFGPA